MTKLFLVVAIFFQLSFNTHYDCGFDDGEYDAIAKYYNPKTYYTATYDLTVDVKNCKVTVIHFPKGGWLDNTHIKAANLDKDGDASATDDKYRKWSIHIDKPE